MPHALTPEVARQKAREVHFGKYEGSSDQAPGNHVADSQIREKLFDSLTNVGSVTRAGRANTVASRKLWSPQSDDQLAQIGTSLGEKQSGDTHLMTDQYTAERVRNMKTEVLSRFVQDLIIPRTTIVNNFFTTIQADAGETLGQLREFVTYVETISDWTYHRIDPNRGDIRPIEVNVSQYSERVSTFMQMYGAKIEYENYLNRVLPNVSIAEVFAMLTVGWAKASAIQREYDASQFLTRYLNPATAFDNNKGGESALGQLSGVGMNGKPNGTFSVDYDFPRLLDYMQGELGMATDNLVMLLPRNAWAFMNMRKGYKRFLGTDGQPLYQRPNIDRAKKPAMWEDDRYGIRNKGVGFNTPEAGAQYIEGSRENRAAEAAEAMVPGNMPFLPNSVPNWMNTYTLPNSVFGPMRVVLTPFAQASHRFYAEGHPRRIDPMTNRPRPVLVSDILLFDGNHPLYLVETVPPTSWTATNDEYRKSTVMMVEGYAMAASARGEQAVEIKGAVLDHSWEHDITLDADKLVDTENGVGDGLEKNA